MRNHETPAARYRRLAAECLDVANTFPRGDQGDALLQMAQVWQRLANQHEAASPSFVPSGTAPEQPVMQEQQQLQPDDDKKE